MNNLLGRRTGNDPPSPKPFNQPKRLFIGETLDDKKLVFQKGKQKELFQHFFKNHGFTHRALGKLIGFSRRNVTSYFNEKILIRLSTPHKLIEIDGEQTGTNSWKRIKKYFAEVGSSNLRHIVRFEERLKNNRFLYQEEALKYFPEYEHLTLAHFGPVV